MKRRNFLASMFALPFASKPVVAKATRLELIEDIELPYVGVNVYGLSRHEVLARFPEMYRFAEEVTARNAREIRQLTEALRNNAPTGFKKPPEKK